MEEKDIKQDFDKRLILARRASLKKQEIVNQRLEIIASVKGIHFAVDNFGYSPLGSIETITELENPVIWIFCHEELGIYYQDYREVIAGRVKALISINTAFTDGLMNILKKDVDFFANVENMESAVGSALMYCDAGDIVLFSPAKPLDENSMDLTASNFREEIKRIKL